MRDHIRRLALNDELHARPFLPARAPERATHIAMLSGEDGQQEDLAHLARLCAQYGIEPPSEASHFVHDFGSYRLKWERHTEFCAYTFLAPAGRDEPFADPVIRQVPEAWLDGLPGERLVAVHLHLADSSAVTADEAAMTALFGTDVMASSRLAGGSAIVCSDFRIHPDGFGRILLVQTPDLDEQGAGRLIQRLFEIETYRMMALLAFPLAREVGPRISAIERRLAEITGRLPSIEDMEDERHHLDILSRLSAELEGIISETSYRFSAAAAYNALIERHIEDLQEVRRTRAQTIGEFLERRLAPAMRTCESVVGRQEAMSRRLARASDMLRTRVDVGLEQQNRNLLRSMNQRARVQLRLQQTVEGLSVVAISYYLVGLIRYALKDAEEAGVEVGAVHHYQIIVTPVVVLLVWLGLRRLRKGLHKLENDPPSSI